MGKFRLGASRKVPPPKPWVKAKSSLSGRNYFITRHHQAGVNLENSRHFANWDETPGQMFKPGQSRPNRDVW